MKETSNKLTQHGSQISACSHVTNTRALNAFSPRIYEAKLWVISQTLCSPAQYYYFVWSEFKDMCVINRMICAWSLDNKLMPEWLREGHCLLHCMMKYIMCVVLPLRPCTCVIIIYLPNKLLAAVIIVWKSSYTVHYTIPNCIIFNNIKRLYIKQLNAHIWGWIHIAGQLCVVVLKIRKTITFSIKKKNNKTLQT